LTFVTDRLYLRPHLRHLVNIKKYITRKFLFRLGLFLALLAGAWLFDYYHQGNGVEAATASSAGSGAATANPGFYCTQQVAVTLKSPLQKSMHSRFLQEKMNRIIMEQWNARLVFLRKAEALNPPHFLILARNLISFRYHFLHHPDDQPPL